MLSKAQEREIRRILEKFKVGNKGEEIVHEVNPNLPRNSRENYLYFFLSCVINFQRDSARLWKSALETWEDEKTRQVFFPEYVCKIEIKTLANMMLKHKLALQPNKHPDIWHKISITLHNYYFDDPRMLLEEGEYRVSKIIKIISESKSELFPYLRGVKLSNYLLAVLNWRTDANFSDIFNLSIIPDTHIVQSTIRLGLAKEHVKPIEVEKIWRPILKEMDISPPDMHSALWRWSKAKYPAV